VKSRPLCVESVGCDNLESFRYKGGGWMGKERKEIFQRALRVL